MNKFWHKHQNSAWRDFTTFGGTPFYIFIIMILTFLREEALVKKLITGFLLTFAAIILIRTFYFKNRPQQEEHHTFIQRIDASSFPSWHAARALFMALTLGLWFADAVLTAFFVLLALLVGYSRIYLQKHDWIDVGGGLVLGLITFVFILYI